MTASPPPVLPDERLAAGIARLAVRYRGHFSPETVQRLVTDSYGRLAEHARVRTHLVLLAEHLAAERLDALARVQGAPGCGLPRVLFVCSHNTGRSQLAAALLAHRANGRVAVSSAGTNPGTDVEPAVAQVLAEAGVDLTDAFPKPLTDEVVQAADIVITMGCGDACPVVPGRRYLDWPVTDPEGAPIATVRSIRDEIDARITDLLASLPSI
ncbi:three-helix bundle dimerization domain-containing protein [Streptomyces sp. Adlamb9]|uniref:arsenate reductase/protein-tyrosine-phosphatase family protein n=1 Tax=Streptomyces sp. Adlamb9 TaxID=3400629 RepID=UPI003F1B4CD8